MASLEFSATLSVATVSPSFSLDVLLAPSMSSSQTTATMSVEPTGGGASSPPSTTSTDLLLTISLPLAVIILLLVAGLTIISIYTCFLRRSKLPFRWRRRNDCFKWKLPKPPSPECEVISLESAKDPHASPNKHFHSWGTPRYNRQDGQNEGRRTSNLDVEEGIYNGGSMASAHSGISALSEEDSSISCPSATVSSYQGEEDRFLSRNVTQQYSGILGYKSGRPGSNYSLHSQQITTVHGSRWSRQHKRYSYNNRRRGDRSRSRSRSRSPKVSRSEYRYKPDPMNKAGQQYLSYHTLPNSGQTAIPIRASRSDDFVRCGSHGHRFHGAQEPHPPRPSDPTSQWVESTRHHHVSESHPPTHLSSSNQFLPHSSLNLLDVVTCLVHQENCRILRCPCREVKQRFQHLMPQMKEHMAKEAGKVVDDVQNLNPNIHPHYQMISRSHLRRQRSRSPLSEKRGENSRKEHPKSCDHRVPMGPLPTSHPMIKGPHKGTQFGNEGSDLSRTTYTIASGDSGIGANTYSSHASYNQSLSDHSHAESVRLGSNLMISSQSEMPSVAKDAPIPSQFPRVSGLHQPLIPNTNSFRKQAWSSEQQILLHSPLLNASRFHDGLSDRTITERGIDRLLCLPDHFTLISTLTCTSNEMRFEDKVNDFILEIPEGAIPPESQNLTLDVGVALFGPFQFPEGLRPVSPVFWVCVRHQPDFIFSKPVSLTLPHFLNLKNDRDIQSLSLTFLKAGHNSNQKRMYDFRLTDGETKFETLKRSAKLETTHFCSLCIACRDTPEVLENTTFCITAVLPNSAIPVGKKTYAFFFVTFLNLKTCLRKVDEIIARKELNGYTKTREEFEFEDDDEDDGSADPILAIDITQPRHGKIGVMGKKKIQRSKVDIFSRNITEENLKEQESEDFYPPTFRLFLSCSQRDVTLSDAKIEFRGTTSDPEFDIYLDVPDTGTAGIRDLYQVKSKLLRVTVRWKHIGLALGLKSETLDSIESNHRTSEDCLTAMATEWLNRAFSVEEKGEPTLKRLREAVQDPAGGNNPVVALDIFHNWTFQTLC